MPATARSRESYPRSGSHIHAAGNDESQAPRQRVGDECRRRLMSMLSCAMDSSAAPSAVLAAATERPSDVSAAIAEWGMVPQTPTAITTTGSKVHVCGSCASGTRRTTEAHGLRMSHGSYLACLRSAACELVNHYLAKRGGWRSSEHVVCTLLPAEEAGGKRTKMSMLTY